MKGSLIRLALSGLMIVFVLANSLSQEFLFERHSFKDAFYEAKPELIFGDLHSMIWFGTSQGLFSFDGTEYRAYAKGDSTSAKVTAIFHASDKVLWVGYDDGSLFILDQDTLSRVSTFTSDYPISGIQQDHLGQIWIATYGGGVKILQSGSAQVLKHWVHPSSNDIYTMEADLSGRIWIGTDEGIRICSFLNDEIAFEQIDRSSGLPDEVILDLHADESGNMWIGTHSSGVAVFDFESQGYASMTPNWNNGPITSIESYNELELWVGTERKGVFIIPVGSEDTSRVSTRRVHNVEGKIYDLFQDVEGNIWIASNESGVLHTNRQIEFNRAPIQYVQALWVDYNNHLWVGTQKGLFKSNAWEEQDFKQIEWSKDLNVISLFEDDQHNLWVGTFDDGVYIFDQESPPVHLQAKDGLVNESILSINGDGTHIWLATLGGVLQIKPMPSGYQIEPINGESGLGTNYVYTVFIDQNKNVWFGTDGNGVSIKDRDNRYENFNQIRVRRGDTTDQITLKTVYSITENGDGDIWMYTAKNGIIQYNGETFEQYGYQSGLRDLNIATIFPAGENGIIAVHPTGLDLITGSQVHFIPFGKSDEFQFINPSLNAHYTDSLGHTWIGGENGMIKYTPLHEPISYHPRTRLTSVSVLLEEVSFQETQAFSHEQNSFTFEYVGIWFNRPDAVTYRYRLVGHQDNWMETIGQRINYNNLPPGDYRFEVTSSENKQWYPGHVCSYSFTIYAPIWQSWWFILGVGFLAVGSLYYYIRQRDRRIQRKNLLEKEQISSQLEVIRSQINPHFLFNSFNTLSAVIEESPKDAVKYVEHFSDFFRKTLQYRGKDVISLEEELDLVENFCFLLKERYGDALCIKNELVLGKERYGIVPMALQILLENAIKHNIVSRHQPLQVSISFRKEGKESYVFVRNNKQLKMTKEPSTKFGLQGLQKRYMLICRKGIQVTDDSRTFEVGLPLIQISDDENFNC